MTYFYSDFSKNYFIFFQFFQHFFFQCIKKNIVNLDVDNNEIHIYHSDPLVESVPAGIYQPGIQIRNLKKAYCIGILDRTVSLR